MALTMLLTIFILPSLFLVSTLWNLAWNYAAARKVGLPVVIVPISPENPVWMLVGRYFLPFIELLPFGNGHFTRFCHIGWEFDEKSRAHLELGDAFMFATPAKNWIYLCNADTTHDIIRRERYGEFARPVELLAVLDVFGPNISTVNGKDWQRQRKATASSFNEQNNVLVWAESLRQGQQLLEYWKAADKTGVKRMAHDTRTLTLNILVHAAFGKSFDFQGGRGKLSSSSPLSYRDALATILENAILILALGPNLLNKVAFIPGLRLLSHAANEFKRYMTEMFDENSERTNAQGNLITSLVRASKNEKSMTFEEVIGNIFVFNFAGHDTTAHSFAFTLMLLAAYPNVQEWMAEEINFVLQNDDFGNLPYDSFPRFVRTLAILLETLRLYDPLLSIVKGTEMQAAQLTIGDKNVTVPPDTRIILNINAMHSLPRYWGDDALEWKPSRWIGTNAGEGPIHDREYIITPEHGAYVPWSEGIRSCPGKKFSQVEHVAVMVSMFREHVVAPVRKDGESEQDARERAKDTVKDTGMKLLLQMFHPEKTPLKWRKRA